MYLKLPEPRSAGLILSYRCSSRCKHCLYNCSPFWENTWISKEALKEILQILSQYLERSLFLSFNYGLHLTGGEPFLNYPLLFEAVSFSKSLGIRPLLIETNAHWCTDKNRAYNKLSELKKAGLDGILISVNPFLAEYVPFKNTEILIEAASQFFGDRVIIYQKIFYQVFKTLNLKDKISLEEFLKISHRSFYFSELLPMGRACYKLAFLFKRYPPQVFFEENCLGEFLNPYHVHVDNFGNYILGFCAGLSPVKIYDLPKILRDGLNLAKKPILKALATNLKSLYELAKKDFGYEPLEEGYISKCHLCLDIRKFLVEKGAFFEELSPTEYYYRV